jgi:hypothetical protein
MVQQSALSARTLQEMGYQTRVITLEYRQMTGDDDDGRGRQFLLTSTSLICVQRRMLREGG